MGGVKISRVELEECVGAAGLGRRDGGGDGTWLSIGSSSKFGVWLADIGDRGGPQVSSPSRPRESFTDSMANSVRPNMVES